MSKTRATALLLALGITMTAVPAHAGDHVWYIAPPAKYDHAYMGKLTINVVGGEDSVRALCPDVTFQPDIGALACSHFDKARTWCEITIADDATIARYGWPTELIYRHEIGHCNGWGADHADALPWEDWAVETKDVRKTMSSTPVLPESKPENPFANLNWNKIILENAKAQCLKDPTQPYCPKKPR